MTPNIPGIESFVTERLSAERLSAGDLAELCRLHQDPNVMATLSADGGVIADDETRRMLQRNLEHWDQYGYGLWMFRDRVDRQFVGRGGLKHVDVEGRDEVELAYAVISPHWGKRFATEMATAIVALGFQRLGLAEIVCFTLTTNRASQRVMQKAGFTYERDIVHAGLPHVLYRLTAGEWRRR